MKCKPRRGMMYLHWHHKGQKRDPIYNDTLRIVSIDPGVINYCIRIEDRYIGGKVKTILHELISFKKTDRARYTKLTTYLDSKWNLLKRCHLIFIEKQLWWSANACRMGQHTVTYFMMRTRNKRNMPLLFEVDSTLKTKVLAESKPKNTKKWAIEKALYYLDLREDVESIDKINESDKKDDLADVVVQAEACMIEMNMIDYYTRRQAKLIFN